MLLVPVLLSAASLYVASGGGPRATAVCGALWESRSRRLGGGGGRCSGWAEHLEGPGWQARATKSDTACRAPKPGRATRFARCPLPARRVVRCGAGAPRPRPRPRRRSRRARPHPVRRTIAIMQHCGSQVSACACVRVCVAACAPGSSWCCRPRAPPLASSPGRSAQSPGARRGERAGRRWRSRRRLVTRVWAAGKPTLLCPPVPTYFCSPPCALRFSLALRNERRCSWPVRLMLDDNGADAGAGADAGGARPPS